MDGALHSYLLRLVEEAKAAVAAIPVAEDYVGLPPQEVRAHRLPKIVEALDAVRWLQGFWATERTADFDQRMRRWESRQDRSERASAAASMLGK